MRSVLWGLFAKLPQSYFAALLSVQNKYLDIYADTDKSVIGQISDDTHLAARQGSICLSFFKHDCQNLAGSSLFNGLLGTSVLCWKPVGSSR